MPDRWPKSFLSCRWRLFPPSVSSRKPIVNREFPLSLPTRRSFVKNSKFIVFPTRVEIRGSGKDGPSAGAFCTSVLFSRIIRFKLEIGEHEQGEEGWIKEKDGGETSRMASPLDSLLTTFKNSLRHLVIVGFSTTLFSACFKIFLGTM